MKAKIKIAAAILAVLLISSCSREGFKESLGQKNENNGEKPASSAASVEQSAEDFIFDLDSKEYSEDKVNYYYALPVAANDMAEKAVEKISDQLKSIISSIPAEVAAGREYNDVSIYDAVTQNDGKIFSVIYEVELSLNDDELENYAVGLVFDATTGEKKQLKDLMDENTFITLVLDEQTSKLSGRKEEVVAKKRAVLNEEGEKALLKRITAKGGLDVLLNASYYVDGSDLVAIFAADQELGGVIEVSVSM